jgi:hypothetical protein
MEILRQSITYAIITVVKNYCKFPHQDGTIEIPRTPTEIDNIFFDVFEHPIIHESLSPKYTYIPLFKYEKGAKTKYYYTNEDLGDEKLLKIPFELAIKKTFSGGVDGEFFTTKDRHIKKYYANPFARILIVTTERTIKLVDGKVIARTYKRTRSRDFNCKYFKVRTNSEVISFNLNNGDINVGESSRRNKGVKTSRFRRNSFGVIENLIGSNQFFRLTNQINKNSPVYNEFKNVMDDDVFLDTLLIEIRQCEGEPITIVDNEDKLKLRVRFIEFLVKHKKIKTPNDYHKLITTYYPGEVYLKKNDRKLIQASLDSYGILSKFTNKILHTHTDIDIKHLALFCGFFGDEYTKHIGNLKPQAYGYFKSTSSPPYSSEPIKERKNYRRFNLEDIEKENIIKITNSLVDTKSVSHPLRAVSGIYSLFVDHMDMIIQIREFDPNFRMRATNYDDFHTEHIELSKMIATIRKGWSTEYVYDNRMVRKVEESFSMLGADLVERTFSPHILKRDEEYSEEGSYMHHCVAGYANKESSIIISIRTDNEKDRVTCEFDKKTGECIQERHFCNRIPPEHFTEPLRMLRERVKRFSHQRLLTHLETKKVRVKINGKEVPIPQLQGGNNLNLPNHHLFEF